MDAAFQCVPYPLTKLHKFGIDFDILVARACKGTSIILSMRAGLGVMRTIRSAPFQSGSARRDDRSTRMGKGPRCLALISSAKPNSSAHTPADPNGRLARSMRTT